MVCTETGKLRQYIGRRAISIVRRMLSFVRTTTRYLITIGSKQTKSSALVVLWPRLRSVDEAREQLWRAHYYLPESEVVLWVNSTMRDVPLSKPDHFGEVKPSARNPRTIQGTRTYLSYIWRTLRQRGTLLVWKRPDCRLARWLFPILTLICDLDTIDRWNDKWDGWAYIYLHNRLSGHLVHPSEYRHRFLSYLGSLPHYDRCYVFGTGPSLALAGNLDFSDGYRVVCNTIVRDYVLLERLRPHLIVAGDGIYHFGYSTFAYAFRSDLVRLLQTQDTMFAYPDVFDGIAKRELDAVHSKLIGIPLCSSEKPWLQPGYPYGILPPRSWKRFESASPASGEYPGEAGISPRLRWPSTKRQVLLEKLRQAYL